MFNWDMFNRYPYINLTDRNLDFLTKAIRDMQNEVKNFVSINAVKYADPIQWNINRQYEKNTIVIDPLTGTAFISVQPVPNGVALTRTEYWTPVFDLSQFVTKAASNFANSYERDITTTATMATGAGDWVVWDSTLYVALNAIHAGDAYVVGGNIKRMTVEDFYDLLMEAIHSLDEELDTEIRNRTNADATLQANIDAEAQAREDADDTLQSNIGAAVSTLTGNLNVEKSERQSADDHLNTLISQEAADRQGEINHLWSYINKVDVFRMFTNKRIMILGDSISDENTQPPNWVSRLRDFTANMNCTIFNKAYNGGFLVGSNEICSKAASYSETDIDIVIIEAGTNDCNIQFPIGQFTDTTYDTVMGALNKLNDTLISKWPNALVYYIMPSKAASDELLAHNLITPQYVPRCMYRCAIECQATRFNWNVIDSTYGLPRFNLGNDRERVAFSDDIHPLPSYSQMFMDYIVKQMLSGGTTKCGIMHSAYIFTNPAYNMGSSDFTGGQGDIHFYSDGRINLKFNGTATRSGALNVMVNMPTALRDLLFSTLPFSGGFVNNVSVPVFYYGASNVQIIAEAGQSVVINSWFNCLDKFADFTDDISL